MIASRDTWAVTEIPDQLAGFGIIGAYETTNAILAAIGADENLAVHRGRRHRLAVAERGIGDLGLPGHLAGLGVQRDQLGIERRQIHLVAGHRDTAVVGTAAIDRQRSQLLRIVPDLLAGARVQRIDVIERCGDVHDAVDDDRCCLR